MPQCVETRWAWNVLRAVTKGSLEIVPPHFFEVICLPSATISCAHAFPDFIAILNIPAPTPFLLCSAIPHYLFPMALPLSSLAKDVRMNLNNPDCPFPVPLPNSTAEDKTYKLISEHVDFRFEGVYGNIAAFRFLEKFADNSPWRPANADAARIAIKSLKTSGH